MICKICDRQIGNKGFSSHLRNTHKISNQEYYDTYIGTNDEKFCYCGKPNAFLGIPYGYSKHCSAKCSMNDPKTTEKRINTNLKVFGTENPFQNEDIKKVIHSKICNKFGGMGANSEKIRQKMYKSMRTDGKITYEQQIFEQLLKIYPNCKHDYKTKLYPYKCDFYIPEEDLYIELNLYWMHGGH